MELFEEIKKEKNDISPEKPICLKTDGIVFNLILLKLH